MIASVETDVFALDLTPAAKLGRDSLFLSPAYALFCPPPPQKPCKKVDRSKISGTAGGQR